MAKMTLQQAEERFGSDAIIRLLDIPAEPTGRLIYPAFEPEHDGMDEFMSDGSVEVDGGEIYAYYFQPSGSDSDDWRFGELNGFPYGDIDNVEFVEC